MALFLKRDFSPAVLSPRWIAIKCRPNMLLRSRSHVMAILESGLLFREDSATVEQEAEWSEPGPGRAGWLTPGERWLSAGAVLVGVAIAPPTLSISRRGACVRVCAYVGCVLAARCAHRRLTRSVLPALLQLLVDYTTLARRTLLCLKEYKFVHRGLESMRGVTEAGTSLLWRQQGSLAELMTRCSLALLGNVPWLYDDVLWDSVLRQEGTSAPQQAELAKIHHALLVVQSTFLKNVAMAHFVQPRNSRKIFDNHNERIYWLHTELLQHLYTEVKENYDALDRMYRLLKNFTSNEASNMEKISGLALNDSWLYSEVHAGVARATMELKVALNKCTGLDVFLDGCAMNKHRIDVDTLNEDLESLIDGLMECVTTVQNSQIKLKKIQCKLNPHRVRYDIEKEAQEEVVHVNEILKIEDKDPESKDEVFYFIKTEEDDTKNEATVDIVTAPGKKERDNTKIVLGELKKKLVKREDLMRQREKIALAKTMPELKGNLPEFPRQIIFDETLEITKGYISKLQNNTMKCCKKKLSKPIKHSTGKIKLKKRTKYDFQIKTKTSEMTPNFDSKPTKLLPKVKHSNLKTTYKYLLTISVKDKIYIINKWVEKPNLTVETDFESSDISHGVSNVESSSKNNRTVDKNPKLRDAKTSHESRHEKFVRQELQLSASSSESDFDFYKERKEQLSLLKDIRRHRAARKKNHPNIASISVEKDLKKDTEVMDEGLKPVEYSFGTGMALASLVQGGKMRLSNMGQEEVFIGDGEVSSDSGNDEGS